MFIEDKVSSTHYFGVIHKVISIPRKCNNVWSQASWTMNVRRLSVGGVGVRVCKISWKRCPYLKEWHGGVGVLLSLIHSTSSKLHLFPMQFVSHLMANKFIVQECIVRREVGRWSGGESVGHNVQRGPSVHAWGDPPPETLALFFLLICKFALFASEVVR